MSSEAIRSAFMAGGLELSGVNHPRRMTDRDASSRRSRPHVE